MKEQMAKLLESHLKVIEVLNNPSMIQHIRANPSHVPAADKDTADFLRQ
jgi:hypothetical protein